MGASSPIALSRAVRGLEGFYFRVGNNDHTTLSRLIAEGKLHVDGLSLDARRHDRHRALREHAAQVGIATCFDTQAMELVMPGTSSKGHSQLPWAELRSPSDFTRKRVEAFAEGVVTRVMDGAYPQVMAPTHYVTDLDSEWLDIDASLTRELRAQLNAADQDSVRIIYPLAIHHNIFYDSKSRAALQRYLRTLPVDMVALRIHPFGSASGPHVIRSYMEACWDLRAIGIPLMIERAGIAGLAAFALGAVDLVESGITTGDSFDVGSLQKPLKPGKKSKFSAPQRVYIEALGMAVERKVAAKLMNTPRGKLHFACKSPSCCSNGYQNMLEDSERHSALARQHQFLEISKVPPSLRAGHFIDRVVTPLCDMLGRARDLDESFKNVHRRTLSVKEMLVDLQREAKQMRERLVLENLPLPPRNEGKVIHLKPREPKGW